MLELIDGRDQSTPVHIPRPKPVGAQANPEETVREVIENVRLRGDAAVLEYNERFDRATLAPDEIRVPEATIHKARGLVRPELIDALEVMAERLRATCDRAVPAGWLEQRDDEFVGELVRPLRRVGIYTPGGRAAYPSTVIMATVPARVAGVDGVALCSPPRPGGE